MAKKATSKSAQPTSGNDSATIDNKETKMATNKPINQIPFDAGLVKRTVENTFPFTLEFGYNSILVCVGTDDGTKAPWLVGKDQGNRVHEILNATTAIWNNQYPVFEPGYCYLHKSLYDAKQELGDNNVGYVIGGERLISDIDAGVYVKPPRPITNGTLYRIHWNNRVFSLWEVKDRPATAVEPMWVKHDRRAIQLIGGMEDIYKGIERGQSIRLYIFPEVEKLATKKIKQYNMVLTGDFDGLKNDQRDGANKSAQYDQFKYLEVQPEKAARVLELHGTEIRIVGNGKVDANELIGHKVQYYRGQNLPIPGQYEVTAQNVHIVASMCKMMAYSVALLD